MLNKNLFGEDVNINEDKLEFDRFKLRLVGGYEFDEVASALQKTIRRGKEREALYWAAIIYKSRYSKYLKKRLSVIIHEDIGISNPLALIYANQLKLDADGKKRNKDLETSDKGVDRFLPIANLILMACRSKKTRMADEVSNLVFEQIEEGCFEEIASYCKDPHVRAGKKKYGRWNTGSLEENVIRIRLWFLYWSFLENEDRDKLDYREEIKRKWGFYGKSFDGKRSLPKEKMKEVIAKVNKIIQDGQE